MDRILEILVRENEDEDFDLLETVREMAAHAGWKGILTGALEILEHPEQKAFWRQATAIIYWAVSDGADMPCPKMEVVARLYWCLAQYPGFGGTGLDDAENLVWTIAARLKGVDYLSEWDPFQDPLTRAFLAKLSHLGESVE